MGYSVSAKLPVVAVFLGSTPVLQIHRDSGLAAVALVLKRIAIMRSISDSHGPAATGSGRTRFSFRRICRASRVALSQGTLGLVHGACIPVGPDELQELMELGGWKSFEMVLRYAHLAPEHLASAAKRIERAWEVVEADPTNSLRQA